MGDFNEILSLNEVKGGQFSFSRAYTFANVLDQCDLMDIGTIGTKFTWCRSVQGRRKMLKGLDRVLTNISWRHTFTEAFVETLCRVYSDHHPILLQCLGMPLPRGQKPF